MSKKKRKKKARITNRQAKIRENSMKQNKQPIPKYKNLMEKVKKDLNKRGLYTENAENRESLDSLKMSAVILKLAEPLLKKYGDDDKRIETIIFLTIAEWNRLLLPEDSQENFQDEIFDTLSPPGDDAATVGSLLYISDLISERKKKYFPDLKKVIIDRELFVSNGNITLNIASAPID